MRSRDVSIKLYETIDETLPKFAVIVAKSNGNWVFCKHRERDTYESPGGRREAGESIMETAHRELYEETGAIEYDLKPVCYYSVTIPGVFDGKETFGLLCYADITEFEKELHCEIEQVIITDELPDKWTYPSTQRFLLNELEKRNFI